MSKNTTKEKKTLSPNEKKAILIAAIAVVMAIILAVSLSLVLKKSSTTTTTPDDSSSSGTSSLYIKNGDFAYFNTETEDYPKSEDYWKLYTFEAAVSENEHKFGDIDSDKVVAGVVDTSESAWSNVSASLTDKGLSGITNPGIHDDSLDTNVYMLSTTEEYCACMMSTNFTISSQASAKITVWLNTKQLISGDVVIMVQQYNSSTLSALEKYRFANLSNVEAQDEWTSYELYVFNRDASDMRLCLSIGVGDCYEGTLAEGTIFVDDISYTTVTANDYREYADRDDAEKDSLTNYSIIGKEAEEDVEYAEFTGATATTSPANFVAEGGWAEARLDGNAYSPFTKDEIFTIYKISNDGTNSGVVAMELSKDADGQDIIIQSSDELKDHLHISFWVRVYQVDPSTALANITLLRSDYDEGTHAWSEFEKVDLSSWGENFTTSQDIDTDTNNGWKKYDLFVKPTSSAKSQLKLVVSLGNYEGNAGVAEKYIPNGSVLVTSPIVEKISQTTYNDGTGSNSKQVNLKSGVLASTGISNGSFSNTATSVLSQPQTWVPVFAGQNTIYKDGQGTQDFGIDKKSTSIESSLIKNNSELSPAADDYEHNVLMLKNNVATSQGYLSGDITLSAKTVYAFSVMAKTKADANPFIYIVSNGSESIEDRANHVIGRIESAANASNVDAMKALDAKLTIPFFQANIDNNYDSTNGWIRYYIIIITGEESLTVRMALFNGSIDDPTKVQAGTVYYDSASLYTLGTYSVDTTEDEELENRERIKWTVKSGSGITLFDEMTDDEIDAITTENTNVYVNNLADFEEIVEKAMNPEETSDTTDTTTTTEKTPIKWGLLLSVISSIVLVGALLIVVVIRIFKRRNRA